MDDKENSNCSDDIAFTQDQLEAIEGIRRGFQDVEQGRTRLLAELFAEIRENHSIPLQSVPKSPSSTPAL